MKRSKHAVAWTLAAGLLAWTGCETLRSAAPANPVPLSERTSAGGSSGVTSSAMGDSTGGTSAGTTDMGTQTPAKPLGRGGAGQEGVPLNLERARERSANSGSLPGSGSHLGSDRSLGF